MDHIPCPLFYVTAGRGTEYFAEKEIRNKLLADIISLSDEEQTHEGKIFFRFEDNTSFELEQMLKLKSVERIFVSISGYSNKEFIKGKRPFLNKLMSEVSCVQNYSFAQRVMKQLMSLAHISGQSNLLGQPVTRKARLHSNTGDNGNSCGSASKRVKLQEKSDCSSETASECNECSCQDKGCSDEPNDFLDVDRNTSPNSKGLFSFRLSIKCSGKISRWLNIKKLGKDLSWRVSKATNWIVGLRNPDYEVCLHISDQFVTMGIPLTRLPLSRRKFLLDPGLRGPIAWIMTSLAGIKSGDLVLDPMCGKGTLLLESCSELQEAIYVGVDNNCEQLASAMRNAKKAGFEKHIHYLQANALNLPLRTGVVDAVLCDAPFNQKYFTSLKADQFYVYFLSEMTRLLQNDGKLILLTSQELSVLVIDILQVSGKESHEGSPAQKGELSDIIGKTNDDGNKSAYESSIKISLQLLMKYDVKLGETLATIIVMRKISNE